MLEDEAELVRAEGSTDLLELVGVGSDVTLGAGGIHQHHVHVTGEQGLDSGAKGVEELDAGVLFVAVEDIVNGGIEIGGAGLGADQQLGIGGEGFFIGKAAFFGTDQHVLLGDHVGVGKVDLFLALVIDGNEQGASYCDHVRRRFF